MNIDERLERLTERHEALAQAVELMASQQQKTEEKLERLTDLVLPIAELIRRHDARLDKLEGR